MNRNIASALAMGTATLAAALAVIAIASRPAYADDITIDQTPFVSTRTRADVRAELMGRSRGDNEWVRQYNQASQAATGYTREQATADYKASRDYVSAVNGEDSGSAYFTRTAAGRSMNTNLAGLTR
jgi:hypothetical protein